MTKELGGCLSFLVWCVKFLFSDTNTQKIHKKINETGDVVNGYRLTYVPLSLVWLCSAAKFSQVAIKYTRLLHGENKWVSIIFKEMLYFLGFSRILGIPFLAPPFSARTFKLSCIWHISLAFASPFPPFWLRTRQPIYFCMTLVFLSV